MIEKMKKLSLLVTGSEKEAFIGRLRQLGVVHVVELQRGATSEALQAVMALNDRYRNALKRMDEITAGGQGTKVNGGCRADNPIEVLDQLDQLQQTETKMVQEAAALRAKLAQWEPFGDFDPATIGQLQQEANRRVDFFVCPVGKYEAAWEDDFCATKICEDKTSVWFVTFAEETPALEATRLTMQDQPLAAMRQELATLEGRRRENSEALLCLATEGRAAVEAGKAEAESALSLARVQLSSEALAGGVVHLMEGWVPEAQAPEVQAALEDAHVYYEMELPSQEDVVPIKFRNDRFTRIYERITKMYGFPCYQEWDPTLIVAPFFTLFFAICMGDAGYGLLILGYGLLERKGKAKNTPVLGEMLAGCGDIITYLGIATIVIGCCLGGFFGMNLVEIGWVPATTAWGQLITWLGGTVPDTTYSIQMAAALVIGVFHICLAMVVKAVMFSQRYGLKSQISVWGWILLIIGGIVTGILAMTSVLSPEMTKVVLIVIAAISGLAIFLLNDLKRNPLINIGAGLYDTYNMVTGLLGDILSYLRLYALCLAGGMLGAAFNMMGNMVGALADGKNIVVAVLIWAGAIVIFCFGHLFNVLMSSISAFVHPLRLVFVEYFKNSGYEGKGVEYKPFK